MANIKYKIKFWIWKTFNFPYVLPPVEAKLIVSKPAAFDREIVALGSFDLVGIPGDLIAENLQQESFKFTDPKYFMQPARHWKESDPLEDLQRSIKACEDIGGRCD